jgi:hypothetical protein
MYADSTSIDGTILYQGDIITDFPFYILENTQKLKRHEDGHFENDNDAVEGDRSVFAVESKKQSVMVLSQTCDAQRIQMDL